MTNPLKEKQEFFAINGLRFAAAFWVLVFHCSIHFGSLPPLRWVQPIIDQGPMAMTLFFMLSGFVLSYRYKTFLNACEIQEYAAARIARLYPVYLFMGAITIWNIPKTADSFSLYMDFGLVGKLFFLAVIGVLFLFAIQAWFPAFLPPNLWNFGGSWSLSVEALFYSLFPTVRSKIGNLPTQRVMVLAVAMILCMLAIAVGMTVSTLKGQQPSTIFYVLPIFRLPEFLLGVFGFVLFVERNVWKNAICPLGFIFGILLLVAMYYRDLPGLIDYGWLAAFPFLAMFVTGTRMVAPFFITRPVNYLGKASYCVYMAQFTTIPITKSFLSEFTIIQAWLIAISGTLVLAVLTYHLVEVMAYRQTKRLALVIQKNLIAKFSYDASK
jgi:peptidoglycan/LPS O-acetylase OafA/YrhL